jgi:hypothetical protein
MPDGDILSLAAAFAPAIADKVASYIAEGHKVKAQDLLLLIQADTNRTMHDLLDTIRNDHAVFHCAFEDIDTNIRRIDATVTKKG